MRQVASAAGVTVGTVSMSLRNHACIPEATRKRVRKAAAKLGYSPDPTVTRLMVHLRTQRDRRAQSYLCALTTHPPYPSSLPSTYWTELMESLRKRARELGYGMDLIHISQYLKQPGRLQRILSNRNIEGLVLLPMAVPVSLDHLLDWTQFSVVATSHSIISPSFHRVLPDHIKNTLTACERLASHGYCRIGLVISASKDLAVRHNFVTAISYHNQFSGLEPVPPLIDPTRNFTHLESWLSRHRPDAVITENDSRLLEAAAKLGIKVPGDMAVATHFRPNTRLFAGIDEMTDVIGSQAIEVLASMLQHGAKGPPETPVTTSVEGRWVEGDSLRRSP